ncbi:Golgi transport complex subunit COG6 Ecym_3311 [Eremothecium cymbalariae DBVPG|uniref:Conserved oligomeric Golgi complex subunit 6 n=1 Tax=Eremothecium cymbalariae (strain CBS 270.75 / DBVPG 7215 / KCTC 17166 / NRRL Y-17582) TaxID=931890 RepID=G8JRN3_ERECY|nr:Hypothetical protein Ecym_3311 [Eremothecium cymbalariae DBVPG\
MDFLDYQAYGVGIGSDDGAGLLPEPASNLSLVANIPVPEVAEASTDFRQDGGLHLAALDNGGWDAGGADIENLHDRMKKYTAMSIKLLPKTGSTTSVANNEVVNSSNDFQILLRKNNTITNSVLSKRLSHLLNDMNHPNYQSDLQLKKSLTVLQEDKIVLGLDIDKLVRADFIGLLSRKSLRSDLEKELLKDHLSVLEDFQPIARKIKRLHKPVERIQALGQQLLEMQDSGHEEVIVDSDVVDLRKRLDHLKLKRKILIGIRDSLILNQLEVEQLDNGVIDESYFQIVNKLMNIKERATYLIGLSNPKAGNALSTKVNEYLRRANKRVFNYLLDFLYEYESMPKSSGQRAFEDNDASLTMFQRCLIYLSNDLEFFNEFLKIVTNMRSKKLLNDFLSQFDVDNRDSKPILLSAHDPVRYLGDVLAHVHTLIANEADFIGSLFKFQDKQIGDAPKSILQENSDVLNSLHMHVLNRIISSLSNSTRIRLEQIVRFEDDALVTFDITQLLKLYQMMFSKHDLSPDNKLIKILHDLEVLANAKILSYYSNYLSAVKTDDQATADLLPPDWLTAYLFKLCGLFDKLEAVSESNDILTADFFNKFVLNPFEMTFLKQAESWFPFSKKDSVSKYNLLILEINGFDIITSRLVPYHNTIFASEAGLDVYHKLSNKLDTFVNQLDELQTRKFFELTGLSLYYNLFNMVFPVASVQDSLDYEMYNSILENPIMSLDIIEANVREKLVEYIPQALMDIQEVWLFNLASLKIAETITSNCFSRFCKFYVVFKNVLLNLFMDDQDRISSILAYSEHEISTLLGITE